MTLLICLRIRRTLPYQHRPVSTPKPSDRPIRSTKKSNPIGLNAFDYYPEDFYEWYYDDFYDYEESEGYYNLGGK